MPSRARAKKMAAIILANGGGLERTPQERWDAVPQERKDRLERFLKHHRENPHGPTFV